MAKHVSILLILSMVGVGTVHAGGCFPSGVLIGSAYQCQISLEQYWVIELPIDLFAAEYPWDIKSVSFRVENWIDSPGYPIGQATVTWFADEVLGSLEDGITLIWEEGQPPDTPNGVRFPLGQVELISFDPAWPGDGHEMLIQEVHYVDVGDHEFDGEETRFIFTDEWDSYGCYPYNWDPPYAWADTRWFDPPSKSTVPSEFVLSFEVHHHSCLMGPPGFRGDVFLGDELIFEFEDGYEVEYSIPITVDDVPPGGGFTVTVSVDYWPYDRGRETEILTYTLEDDTSAGLTTFSTLKANY